MANYVRRMLTDLGNRQDILIQLIFLRLGQNKQLVVENVLCLKRPAVQNNKLKFPDMIWTKVERMKQIGPLMKNYMILMMNLMMGVSQKTTLSKYK